MYAQTLTLANGVKIPQLGLATWFIDDANAAQAVRSAVEPGYRHIDTAQAYGNERGVGEGIRTCDVPREELFVVSKVAAEHKTYEEAKRSIDEMLTKMGLDALNMWGKSFPSAIGQTAITIFKHPNLAFKCDTRALKHPSNRDLTTCSSAHGWRSR